MFEAATQHIRALQESGKRIIVAGWSDGSRERSGHVLAEHGLKRAELASTLSQALAVKDGAIALAVVGLEAGVRDRRLRRHRRAGHFGRPPRAPAPQEQARRRRPDRSRRALRRRSRRPCRSWHRPLCRPRSDHGGRRAARLSRAALCRRRQAFPASRESRTSVAPRLGRYRSAARSPRRLRLAAAQVADEEACPRDRRKV